MPKFQKKKAVVEEPIVAAELSAEETAAADEANQPAPADLPTVDASTLVEVWERRFQNPGGRTSTPVQLKVKGMVTRWINTAIEGRHHRAVYDQGWQPVPTKLLNDPASIPDLYKHPHNIVCRGERGKEVLMMMPADVFKKIQWRKAELNNKALRNIRSEVAGAAANKYGGEAGDFVNRGGTEDGTIKTIGSINFGTERVPMGAE